MYVQQDSFILAGRNWDISWLCVSSENSLPWALAFAWTLQILFYSCAGWCSNTQGNARANFLDYLFVSCRNPLSWFPVANCSSPGFPGLWFCLLELARWPNSVFCVVEQSGDCLQAGSLSGFRAFLAHFFFHFPGIKVTRCLPMSEHSGFKYLMKLFHCLWQKQSPHPGIPACRVAEVLC